MKLGTKILTSALTIATLAGTTLPALAAVGERGIIWPNEEQLTTVYSGPNVGAAVDCYSKVEDHGSYIAFVNRYMETDVGDFTATPNISISGRKVYFDAYVQWVRAKDHVTEVHSY